jgi:hypothetical protein
LIATPALPVLSGLRKPVEQAARYRPRDSRCLPS